MENNKKQIFDRIVKIVLIIIIVILLLHNCVLLRNMGKEKVPTGNVDIIEIICNKDDSCKPDNKGGNGGNTVPTIKDDDKIENDGKKTEPSGPSSASKPNEPAPASSTKPQEEPKPSNPSTKPAQPSEPSSGQPSTPSAPSSEPEPEPDPEELIVKDRRITWDGAITAKIFTNSMYEFEDIIAPESSNTYQFVVKNGTEYQLKYEINFIETNNYNINMKYKLKKNDTYLIDHYVSASELNVSEMLLNSLENDTYYLEWKWISSSNDTEIGMTPDANYGLKIEVRAESTNG